MHIIKANKKITLGKNSKSILYIQYKNKTISLIFPGQVI